MAETASTLGSLVGWERRPYGSFTDRQTGEIRPGGETLWLYVSAPDGNGPVLEVKVREQADFERGVALGFGEPVRLTYRLSAQNNAIQRQLIEIVSDPAAADALAS